MKINLDNLPNDQESYLLISDTHFHNWTRFASNDIVNERLQDVLEDITRQIEWAKRTDHCPRKLVHAGDVFHVRGQLEPSCVNVVNEYLKKWTDVLDMEIFLLSGNHDLETRESISLASSARSVERSNVLSVSEKTPVRPGVVMLPWSHLESETKKMIEQVYEEAKEKGIVGRIDLIIHAPLNKVISGIPDTGLDPDWLAGFGFRNVFCGHYHNHKSFCDGKVWSIGASNHQNWGDVHSKAGVMLVAGKGENSIVKFKETTAPKFVEMDVNTKFPDFSNVNGNFVKVKTVDLTAPECRALRDELMSDYGAKDVTVSNRVTAESEAGDRDVETSINSLEKSVYTYAKDKFSDEVAKVCREIIQEVT